jgi:hypothetical protein
MRALKTSMVRRRAWRLSAHGSPRAVPSVLWARRGPAPTGVLACLVAWVIPGEGQKSSIAENKHGAWSG